MLRVQNSAASMEQDLKNIIPILKNEAHQLTNGIISGLVEDSLNNIWIGTDKGLSRYDMKADTFTNFTPAIVSDNSNDTPLFPFGLPAAMCIVWNPVQGL